MESINDLSENYVSLAQDGEIKIFPGGNEFWHLSTEKLNQIGENWLVTEFYFDKDWQTWEIHPYGKEIVYLLSGSMDLILEKDNIFETIQLRKKALVIVPENTWHTAKVFEPSNMLVITLGKETKVKEA